MTRTANFDRPSFIVRISPAAYFFAFFFAGYGLDHFVPLPIPFPAFAWQLWPALVLFAASAFFAGSAIRLFAAKQTTFLPFSQATQLIITGPYRISRNPMYVALVTALLAFGLLLASFWFMISAALLALVLDHFVIRSEESELSKVFGEQYSAYTRRVRRWL